MVLNSEDDGFVQSSKPLSFFTRQSKKCVLKHIFILIDLWRRHLFFGTVQG